MTQGLPIVTSRQENQGLVVTEFNGFPVKMPYYNLVTRDVAFTGTVDLSNPAGTFWNDYVQTGVLTIVNGSNGQIGGCDRLKITANGSAINLPSNWVNIGSTAVDNTAAAVNRLFIVKVSATEVNYTVKVN